MSLRRAFPSVAPRAVGGQARDGSTRNPPAAGPVASARVAAERPRLDGVIAPGVDQILERGFGVDQPVPELLIMPGLAEVFRGVGKDGVDGILVEVGGV